MVNLSKELYNKSEKFKVRSYNGKILKLSFKDIYLSVVYLYSKYNVEYKNMISPNQLYFLLKIYKIVNLNDILDIPLNTKYILRII